MVYCLVISVCMFIGNIQMHAILCVLKCAYGDLLCLNISCHFIIQFLRMEEWNIAVVTLRVHTRVI